LPNAIFLASGRTFVLDRHFFMKSKDFYWFKHDSGFGRSIEMRKIAHIYGHWGKGIYWDVIEILRDQSNYVFNSDDSSLQLLCDLIGCKDEAKFISWFNDCIKIGLFSTKESCFYSEILCENMGVWETKKVNGSNGGRSNTKRIESELSSETKAKVVAKSKRIESESSSIREEKRRREEKREEKKEFVIPALEDFTKYAEERGFKKEVAETAWHHYNNLGWKDSKGTQISVWKNKLNAVWFKEENKIKQTEARYRVELINHMGNAGTQIVYQKDLETFKSQYPKGTTKIYSITEL